MRAVVSVFIVIASLLAASAVVRAETTATTTIAQMQILTPADDKYANYHGVIWLDYDKAKFNYRWGGKHCAEEGLSEVHLGMLFSAFRAKSPVTLHYKTRLYNSQSYRCITGYTLALK